MFLPIREIIYSVVVVFLAIGINFFAMEIAQQTYWVLLSALLLLILLLQNNFKFHPYTILLTGFIAAMLVLLQVSYFRVLPGLIIYLGLATLILMCLAQRYSAWFFPALIINLCVLLSVVYPAKNEIVYFGNIAFTNNYARAIYIVDGTLIAWIPQLLLGLPALIQPNKNKANVFSDKIFVILYLFRQLNKAIFACFLEPAYQENIYLFERRIHIQKQRIIKNLVEMRVLLQFKKNSNKTEFSNMINQLDLLFDLMLQYAQLRRRVTDNTIFAVCFTELTAIQDEIDKMLADMISTFPHAKYHLLNENLLSTIHRFEEVYQNVLQVTSREPLVFLLFIKSLNDFGNELSVVYNAYSQLEGKVNNHD